MLKVAFDYSYGGGHSKRGVGAYAEELIGSLKEIKDLKLDVFDVKGKDLSNYDLVHYPFFHPYFITLPLIKKTKVVVTIHDIIPLLFPKYYPPGIKGKIRFYLQKLLLNQVDKVITVSETSRKDIVKILGIPESKISIVYNGINEKIHPVNDLGKLKLIKRKYNLPDKFVFYVGDVNYNKNLFNLATACKEANIFLVIAGKKAKEDKVEGGNIELRPFAEFLNQFGKDPLIKRIGYVPYEDLGGIYNLASIYCQPSLYEGFSLAVLEAFSCSCPVVASDIPTHREIAQDAALFAKTDEKDLEEKIKRPLKDNNLRNDLIKKGFERVKNFSWEKAAKETFEVYKEVVKK